MHETLEPLAPVRALASSIYIYVQGGPRRAKARLRLRASPNGGGCRKIQTVNATVLPRGALRSFHG